MLFRLLLSYYSAHPTPSKVRLKSSRKASNGPQPNPTQESSLSFFVSSSVRSMDSSSNRFFNRQRTVHQILGGGTVADVMLWRRKNVTLGILFVTLAAWLVFERSGYTLLSLVANVLLLLIVILFLWAKAAAILNRPPPPLPNMKLSEEAVNEAATVVRLHVNSLLLMFHDVALGKNSKLFFKVAVSLWLITLVGGWTDFLTLGYTSLVIILTVPAFYERYEDHIDKYAMSLCKELRQLYIKLDAECFSKIRKWILEKRKLN